MIEEITEYWNSALNGFTPIAHQLKNQCGERWVRFHSLPESKRYPENEDEYAEILRRHNVVLERLLGGNGKALIVLPEYSYESSPEGLEPALTALFTDSEYWSTLMLHEEGDEDEFYWHLHVSEVNCPSDSLNSLFRMVANDELGNVLIVSSENDFVFHPYDGGCDVILPSSAERDVVKENFQDWLSKHPEGY